MTSLFEDLMNGLDEVDAFLAGEQTSCIQTPPHFHIFHRKPAFPQQILSLPPLAPAPNARSIQPNGRVIFQMERVDRSRCEARQRGSGDVQATEHPPDGTGKLLRRGSNGRRGRAGSRPPRRGGPKRYSDVTWSRFQVFAKIGQRGRVPARALALSLFGCNDARNPAARPQFLW